MLKMKDLISEGNIEYKIYCDMDGVLTNFDKNFEDYIGINSWEYEKKHGSEEFWKDISAQGLEWWSKMPWMPDGKKLWGYIKNKNTEILSAPAKTLPNSSKGKKIWVSRELGGTKLNLARASEKQKFANPNAILIDDLKKNIDQWNSAGGIGILHKSATGTIAALKKLGI